MWKAKLTCGGTCPCINYPFDVEAPKAGQTMADWQKNLANLAFRVHRTFFPECHNSDEKLMQGPLSRAKFQSVSVTTGDAMDWKQAGGRIARPGDVEHGTDNSTGDRPPV